MQIHLNNKDMVNQGSFYTNNNLINLTYQILCKNVDLISQYTILDSSCGYGNFLQHESIKNNVKIGADIDCLALVEAKKYIDNIQLINHNSLLINNRLKYGISDIDKLIIVGNPPYNDTTSLVKNDIKQNIELQMLPCFKSRDLGISFLRSYAILNANYICILHPLSYLIKQKNFQMLREFADNYKLIDGIIVSSKEFDGTSSSKTYFPIIIALYQQSKNGMKYKDIMNFNFTTIEGYSFNLKGFDFIGNYINKYPNINKLSSINVAAKFWTMRDINALKRNRTFIDKINYNTILIDVNDIPYYSYVDIFKTYIKHIPYYFGNLDVFINIKKFNELKDCFIIESAKKNNYLLKYATQNINNYEVKINNYFRELLGNHYVN